MRRILVQSEDFDQAAELALMDGDGVGAKVNFIGIVRNNSEKTLTHITLEHYPSMTGSELNRIADEAEERWSLDHLTIIHRYGDLKVGEQIVLVATASRHREDAFNAAMYVMDYLKTDAPFWKKEHTIDQSSWVKAADKDTKARDRWQ